MRVAGVIALLGLVVLSGCSRDAGTTQGAARQSGAEAAKLEVADAADGAKDHVVAKCAVCGLAMAGSAEHVSSYSGYELRFCSSECKATFDHGPHAVLRRLHAPQR